MGLINVVAHASAIGARFLSHAVTVVTAISVIATTVTIAVVITVVIKNLPGSDNPLISHTVIVKSELKLALNRDILSYELDYYFNATETLFTVVGQLDNQLKGAFPNRFIKIVLSQFSPKPETNITEIRKRRYGAFNEEISYTTQMLSVITNTESSSSSNKSSTTTSNSMFSTVSTLFSALRTIIPKLFLTTTVATTPLEINDITNCTISTFNITKRPSLVYAYGTLYFYVIKPSDITVQNIIDALNQLLASIKLIDICGNPSSANGYFIITRSYISPITETNLTETDLNAMNSISSDLLNQINAVTPPSISTESTSILPTSLIETTGTTADTTTEMSSNSTDIGATT